jgi:large subunit ribosomal protein L22
MLVKSQLNNLRMAPRKVRLVADLIRGKKAADAQRILDFTLRGAASPVLKLLNSALANAENNFKISSDNLYIFKITVDEGPKFKRFMPRARGTAYLVQKKTSHVSILLKEINPSLIKDIDDKKGGKTAKEEDVLNKDKSIKNKRKPMMPKSKTGKIESVKGIKRIFRRKSI